MERGRGHETIEHTADMGIAGWGCGEFEAFEEVALALFELVVEREGLKSTREVDIEAEGEDYEELLVDFLNNLLMKADIEEIAFLDVEVKVIVIDTPTNKFCLKAVARGLSRSRVRDRLLREVKAATYLGVSVGRDESGRTRATVVVDL